MTSSSGRTTSPVSIAVVFSLMAFLFIAAIGVAIGGSYALTWNAVNRYKQEQAQAVQVQDGNSLRVAVGECKQLQAMDTAASGTTVAPGSYDQRLSTAIHSFYIASQCPLLLKDVAQHESDAQIIKQFEG